jgi:hypothetical protein
LSARQPAKTRVAATRRRHRWMSRARAAQSRRRLASGGGALSFRCRWQNAPGGWSCVACPAGVRRNERPRMGRSADSLDRVQLQFRPISRGPRHSAAPQCPVYQVRCTLPSSVAILHSFCCYCVQLQMVFYK